MTFSKNNMNWLIILCVSTILIAILIFKWLIWRFCFKPGKIQDLQVPHHVPFVITQSFGMKERPESTIEIKKNGYVI